MSWIAIIIFLMLAWLITSVVAYVAVRNACIFYIKMYSNILKEEWSQLATATEKVRQEYEQLNKYATALKKSAQEITQRQNKESVH
jgi:hypothetical protein